MITNIEYLKTAVEMLAEGQTPRVELDMLKTMRNICMMNIDRIESEFGPKFDAVMKKNLAELLKGDQDENV